MLKPWQKYRNVIGWKSYRLKLEEPEDVGGSVGEATPQEKPIDDLESLKAALAKERQSIKDFKKQLHEVTGDRDAISEKFKDIDPEKYTALMEERRVLAEQKASWEKAKADLEAKFESDRITLTSAHATELAELKAANEQLQAEMLGLTRSQLLRNEFIAAQGRSEDVDGVSYFKLLNDSIGSRIKLSDDRSHLEIIGDDGNPLMSAEDKTKPMTPAEFLRSLHTHPVLGSCFELKTVPSGSGGNHATRSNVPTTKPLSRKDRLMQAQQES